MAMPLRPNTISDYRELAREVHRLAVVLQGTVSLEGQGMDGAKLRQVKRRMMVRILQGVTWASPAISMIDPSPRCYSGT